MAKNYDDNDFFSEEYEKKQKQTEIHNRQGDDEYEIPSYNLWSQSATRINDNPNKIRRTTAILLAIAFVVVFMFGALLSSFLYNTNDDLAILREVLNTIRHTYYGQLSDAEWEMIIANAGTAMMQTIDRYGILRNPQDSYDYLNPDPQPNDNADGYFGFTFQYLQGFGMIVSTVNADSSSFGVLEDGDIILGISNLKDKNNSNVVDNQNNVVTSIDFSLLTVNEFTAILSKTFKADFAVLRNGATHTFTIERSAIVNSNNSGANQMYCVEYYFGDDNTNLSTTNQGKAQTNSKEHRKLDSLAPDVGYIRIIQFTRYEVNGTIVGCEDEFKIALEKFKASGKTKLVVDLKGNPGGYVENTARLAGMLITEKTLSQESRDKLVSSQGLLVTTLEYYDGANAGSAYTASSYDNYFQYTGFGTKDIAVWTDGNSASASELLTGCLLDYGTAIHMGTTTFGKGIAQSRKDLTNFTGQVTTLDGSLTTFYWTLVFTSARYFSPLGDNIHDIGYTPASPYNNLKTYEQLVNAVNSYWK